MTSLAKRFSRFCLAALLAIAPVAVATDSHANPKYASVVMDMETGQILRSRNADKRLYPASLTKMMTLYMTFEAIRDGKLRLEQNVSISKAAARQPATKLGLRAGKSIKLRHAIQACATKSANDAAVVLAEAVAGSVKNFGILATKRARQLGMSNTTFKNPHGLTKKGQLSSARDMAILGRRLFLDFPEYYHIFKRKQFRYGGRKYRATNKLLGKYKGADGIKTGYTRASGYNLVASAEQNGRRILGVVFGGKSSARRNRHMMKLLDEGFRKLPARPTVVETITIVQATPIPRSNPRHGRVAIASRPSKSSLVVLAQSAQPSVVERSLKVLSDAIVAPAEAAAPAAIVGEWAVQIGAYRTRSYAEKRLKAANRIRPSTLRLGAPIVSVKTSGGRPLYRARYAGLRKSDAERGCNHFAINGIDCFIVNEN